MSSRAASLRSRPARVRRSPRAVDSLADEAVFLASSYGLTPDDWQADVLADWLGRRRDGKWSAKTCGLAVPRQNGKNGIIEVRQLFGMIGLGEKFLHTAHQVKTARKAFLRISSFFENPRKYPELAAMVKEIRKTNGQEAVILSNGGSVEFIARSKNSGRGFTVDVLVCDEAQDLTDDELDALLPTLSAAPLLNTQRIFTGTPPDPEKGETGEVFSRIRLDGEKGRDQRLAWTDYGVPDGPLPDIDDDDLLHAVNPALGIRLGYDEVAEERKLMSPVGYARERFGWWGDGKSLDQLINPNDWADCEDPDSQIVDLPVFAIDVPLDRTVAVIAVAGHRSDELVHGEVIEEHHGTDWVVDWFEADPSRLKFTVGIDVGSPAAGLIQPLLDVGVDVLKLNAQDVAVGSGWMYDAIRDHTFRHGPDPNLEAAVRATTSRPLGESWAFGRRKSARNISRFMSVTLAARALHVRPDYAVLDSFG